MATIRRHRDKWRAIIHRKDVYKSKVFRTKEQAEKWARAIESQIDDGTWQDRTEAEITTLSDALDRYLREITPTKAQTSQEREIYRIRNLQRRPIARKPLAKITGSVMARYRDERLKAVCPQTVQHELHLLRHMFEIAIKEWGIPLVNNPVTMITLPKIARPRDRRLRPGEEERLLAACREYGGIIHDAVIIAIETGMRRGEIAAMRCPNVNLVERTVYLETTKNGESRTVPLSTRATAILRERSKVRDLHDDRVFGVRSDAIGLAFRRVCKRAGIENLRFHDLRHKITSRLFERGLNPMQVASITGHKTLQMLKRYTHLRAEDLVELLG